MLSPRSLCLGDLQLVLGQLPGVHVAPAALVLAQTASLLNLENPGLALPWALPLQLTVQVWPGSQEDGVCVVSGVLGHLNLGKVKELAWWSSG